MSIARINVLFACVALACGCSTTPTTSTAAQTSGAPDIPANDASRLAYGVGFDLGQRSSQGLAADAMNLDPDLLARGFSDAVHGLPSELPPAEVARVMRAVHRMMLDHTAQQLMADDPEFRQIAEQNAARSAAALATFAAQPGVKRLAEGISYVVVAEGSGRGVSADEVAVTNFILTGVDGRQIEQQSGVTIDPERTLPRVGELLRAMKPGDHWRVAVASESAYGLGGDPPRIGPNEAIFVDVTLVELRAREKTP